MWYLRTRPYRKRSGTRRTPQVTSPRSWLPTNWATRTFNTTFQETVMIACIGEALIDFIPTTSRDGNQAYIPSPGGSPYNTAITCGRLDHPPLFLSRLSSDFFGRDLRASL